MFAPAHPDTMIGLVRQHQDDLLEAAARRRRDPRRRHKLVFRRA